MAGTQAKVRIALIGAVSTIGSVLGAALVGVGRAAAGIEFGCGSFVLAVLIAVVPTDVSRLNALVAGVLLRLGSLRRWVGGHAWSAAGICVLMLLPVAVPFGYRAFIEERPACAVPRQVRVLVSQESYTAVTAAVDAFEQQEPGRCFSTHLVVYAAKDDQAAVAAVRAGWPDSALAAIGPRPDVWIPDSPADVRQLAGAGTAPLVKALGTVGYSPLVVAVERDSAIPGTDQQGLTWQSLYQTLAQHGLSLSLPSPDRSDTGLFQLFRLYQGVSGSADRRAVSHRPVFPVDSEDLLCSAQQAAQSGSAGKSAYLVSEAAMIAENTGDVEGSRCQSARRLHLLALYPKDTMALEFPFELLDWNGSALAPGPDTPARAGAVDFQHWLRGPDGASVLLDHGIRPTVCGPYGSGGVFSAVNGVVGSDPSCASAAPTVPTVAQSASTTSVFDAARAPARILVGVDDSDSMAPYLPGIGSALSSALGTAGTSLTSRDSFGLWAFPGPGPEQLYRTLSGMAAADSGHRQAFNVEIAALASPKQPSANYDLLAAAAKGPLAQPPPAGTPAGDVPQPSVVLLTNGDGYPQGDPGGGSAASALQALGSARPAVPVYVLAYGPGGCTPSLTLVANRSGGTCDAADQGDPRQLLAQIFDRLSGG
ncbi:substrate-binding domain-containing protein [Streptacidiphilus carbonis]|uniref:substrate-binding domain-containing protein n=1 Tax=Streptacidiphilus carbonis TaxID=105422 RepID=UPI0005A76F71|nr:substrate-binding domain-containing protein [Streptacidiphilus carbonis]